MKVRDVAMCTLLLAVASVQASEVTPFAVVTVELKNGEIEAEYRLSSPVDHLELARHTTQYRPQSWRVLTSGVTLKDSALLAASGTAFDRVRIGVRALDRSAEKDYDPVLRFSDGGRAIYTGQFDVAGQHGLTTFELGASRKTPVVLAGVKHREPVRYTPAYVGDGTYAYFGRSPPLELPFGLAIVDPALPPWALAELRSFMPAVLGHYHDRLGPQPGVNAFILFNYEAARAGAGNGGDVLPGLVRFVLYGRGWEEDSEKLRRRLRWTIAHEVAHFWNSQTHDEVAAWMHEGSADALAHLALRDLDFITPDELTAAQDGALTRCLMDLEGRSANEAFRQGQYRTAYDCGHVISLLTDAAMRKSDPESGLHEFWRTLLDLARKDGGYTQGHYVANLTRQTGDARMAAFVYNFANQSGKGVEPLAAAFGEVGRPFRQASGEPGPELSRVLYRKLFAHLIAQDCAGRISFDTFDDRVAVYGNAECGVLKQPLNVLKLADFPVYENALALYGVVAEACRKGGIVTLNGSLPGETTALACAKPIAPAPALMTFSPAAAIGAAP